MSIKLSAFAFLFFLLSCNSADKNHTNTGTAIDKTGADIDAQKKALNERSKACIALMNALEEEKNAAQASGDATSASDIQLRIDSAATENVKIGQQLMSLDK